MSEDFGDITFHRILVSDTVRNELYRNAISECVEEGDVVVDIGTGSGLLAFWACEYGASRVYAIERTEIIDIAERIAKDNNLQDKVVFIRGNSSEVELPEKADVVVSELISKFGLGQNLVEVSADARDRFLKVGGRIIPQSLDMILVPVEDEDLYNQISVWDSDFNKVDLSCVKTMALNDTYSRRFRPTNYLSRPEKVHSVNFDMANSSSVVDTEVTFCVNRTGVIHGLCGWFNVRLYNDVFITNEPPSGLSAWDNIFFPFEEPMLLRPSDLIHVHLMATSAAEGCVWRWHIDIPRDSSDKNGTSVHKQSNLWRLHRTVSRSQSG